MSRLLLRRQIVRAAAAVGLVGVVLASCAGPREARIDPDARDGGESDGEVSIGGGEPVTPVPSVPPDTLVVDEGDVARAPQQEQICVGDADSFIPELGGYNVTVAGDLSAFLPVDQPGVTSAAGVQARNAEGKEAIVGVVVADANTGAEPLMQSAIDALSFAVATGVEDVEEQSLGGYLVVGGESESGAVYVWQHCLNVVIGVAGDDGDMVTDIALQILT